MNSTFWCVLGILIGVVCAIAFYEAEYRAKARAADLWEKHARMYARLYREETERLSGE